MCRCTGFDVKRLGIDGQTTPWEVARVLERHDKLSRCESNVKIGQAFLCRDRASVFWNAYMLSFD